MRLSEAKRDLQVTARMGRGCGPVCRGIVRQVHEVDAGNPSGYITVYIPDWLGQSLLDNFHPDDVKPVGTPEEAPE